MFIYEITKNFPKEELYGLVSQMRRAAVSIPSNIGEGKSRGTRKDYRHFLLNSFASGSELETQLLISQKLDYINEENFKKINLDLTEIMKMLNTLIFKNIQTELIF